MAQIFISYGVQDRAFVAQLALGFEEVGIKVVYADALLPGVEWASELGRSMRDADAVLLLISTASLDSRWLMAEAGRAMGYSEERGKPQLIPVILDNIALPLPLSHLHAIYTPDRNVDSLVLQVTRSIEGSLERQRVQQEEDEELRLRLQTNADDYIALSLDKLEKKEKEYRVLAYRWYFVASSGFVVSTVFALHRIGTVTSGPTTWTAVVHAAIGSILVLALLGAFSRFAFVLGKSFMVESLRNNNRVHAISFGRFYLRGYGEKAQWSEIKEAFQHWNIDLGSSFSSQAASDIDPQLIQNALEIAKVLRGNTGK